MQKIMKDILKNIDEESSGVSVLIGQLSVKYEQKLNSLLEEMENDEETITTALRKEGNAGYGELSQFRRIQTDVKSLLNKFSKLVAISKQ